MGIYDYGRTLAIRHSDSRAYLNGVDLGSEYYVPDWSTANAQTPGPMPGYIALATKGGMYWSSINARAYCPAHYTIFAVEPWATQTDPEYAHYTITAHVGDFPLRVPPTKLQKALDSSGASR